jgi:hypothetical protein
MGASVAAAVPQPAGVGPEMAALARFYRDVTWTGTIHEGGMGAGTPAMTGAGRGKAQAIQDGRWIVLDCEQDQFLPDGTFMLRWQLHWVSGWYGEYRAVMTDNYGHAEVYRGRIEGDRLVFESLEGPRPGCASPGMLPARVSSSGATRCRSMRDRGSSSRNTRWCRPDAAEGGAHGRGDPRQSGPELLGPRWSRPAGCGGGNAR